MSDWNRYPRSVRQIGSPEHSCRVYLEDYADAYIRRIQADGPQGVHAGALYGKKMMQDGLQCYYIFGAVETEPVWEEGRLRFGQKAWRRIEQMQREFFPTMEVCGWFVRAEEDFMPGQEQLQRVQDTFFAETGELLFTVNGEEGRFFRKGQSLLYPLQGYYVFYQKNTAMQEYLTETAPGRDTAVRLRRIEAEEREWEQNGQEAEPVIRGTQTAPAARTEQKERRPAQAAWTEQKERRPAQAARTAQKERRPAQAKETKVSAERKEPQEAREPEGGHEWQRRVAAAVLFVLLAGGIVFYGKPERAKALQQMLAQRFFGTEEAVPAAGSASAQTESGSEEQPEAESESDTGTETEAEATVSQENGTNQETEPGSGE